MNFKPVAAMLALSIAATATAVAGDIYKWTDADGNVHYTDVPVGNAAERVAINSRPTDRARVQQQVQARLDRQAERDEQRAQQESESATAEELRLQAEERDMKCERYKERQDRFDHSRRLYREDDNGERVYLDELEVQEARDKVQQQVEEFCNN
jgi:catalase